MYCSNCGCPISEKDKFCSSCGVKAAAAAKAEKNEQNNAQSTRPSAAPTASMPPKAQAAGENKPKQYSGKAVKAVKRVYYDKEGRQVKNPNIKTNSEAAMQGLMIACIAVAVIIVTIAGSMFISGNLVGDTFSDKALSPSVSDTVSEKNADVPPSDDEEKSASSDDVNAVGVSSEEVSLIPDELLAVNMKRRIVGTWETELPYKSMSMPATFIFDDDGKCTCTIKALFISQKFEGTYKVEDGGKCSITLNGIEEYMNGAGTITGNARFISDNELEFTSDGTVWSLKRAS